MNLLHYIALGLPVPIGSHVTGRISKADDGSKLLTDDMIPSIAFRISVIWKGQFFTVVLPTTICSFQVTDCKL